MICRAAAVLLAPVRLNGSPSLPEGLYRLLPAGAVRPGEMVLACPPTPFARLAVQRGYLPTRDCPAGSQPLGKLVLAVAGDRLDVRPDAAGRPLAGSHLVQGQRLGNASSRVER
jgi:type IV secretory pathway protease TraF